MPEQNDAKIYFYLSIGCCVLGFIALGLAFSALGVYSLISSIVLGLASLAFSSAQKRKNNFKGVTLVTVAAYILLGIDLIIFIGGLVYSAMSV